MKTKNKSLVALILALALSLPAPANADWRLESSNSPAGLTAYASTYWINGIGPATYSGFSYYKIPFDTHFASMMIQCTKKKYTATFSLMQTGSAHDDLSLDDPGFIKLQFLNSKLNKKTTYRTYGLGMEGTIAINANAQDLVNNLVKSRTLKMQFVMRNDRVLNAVFDVRDLTLARTRFAYAGCKI